MMNCLNIKPKVDTSDALPPVFINLMVSLFKVIFVILSIAKHMSVKYVYYHIIPDLWSCQMMKTVKTCFCFDYSPLLKGNFFKIGNESWNFRWFFQIFVFQLIAITPKRKEFRTDHLVFH